MEIGISTSVSFCNMQQLKRLIFITDSFIITIPSKLCKCHSTCATVISHNENIFAMYHKTTLQKCDTTAFQSNLKLKTKKKKHVH